MRIQANVIAIAALYVSMTTAFSIAAEPTRNEDSTPRIGVLPVSPALVRPAAQGADVRDIAWAKAALMILGYDAGSLDGRMTARFKASLFAYQRRHGLSATGLLDAKTLSALKGVKL